MVYTCALAVKLYKVTAEVDERLLNYLQQLGRHVVGGADHGVRLRSRLQQLLCDAKVACTNGTLSTDNACAAKMCAQLCTQVTCRSP